MHHRALTAQHDVGLLPRPERLILTGGSSRLAGVSEAVQQRLGLPTSAWMTTDAVHMAALDHDRYGHALGSALGAALPEAGVAVG